MLVNVLSFVLPVLVTAFLWWFTTGIVMAVYGRTRWLTRLCFAGMSVAALAALGGVVLTRSIATPAGVYATLFCGMVVWGWQVASYYLGFITGRKPAPLSDTDTPPNLQTRFRLALQASIYHELFSLAGALLLAALTWDAPNQWSLGVYVMLWLLHTSAKLNVFLGVRNFHIEFLPRHLHHMKALLSKGQSNAFFPLSVAVATSIALLMVYRGLVVTSDPAHTTGYLAIATLMALGLLEHWLLVLPVPSMLWGWSSRPLPPPEPHENENTSPTARMTTRAASTKQMKGQPQ